jgi:xanthine dehydrogenase accessory factor
LTRAADHLRQALAAGPVALVTVHQVQGSGPREEGAWMAVTATEVINTIGGGHLEFQAIEQARALIHAQDRPDPQDPLIVRYALGPSLGQCCGGVVHLRFERVSAAHPAIVPLLQPHGKPLALFGGGHVGRAIVQVMSHLPYRVRWIDSRDEIFPVPWPANTQTEHSDPVQDAVADLEPGSAVLIMSFSHAEDLDIVAACLRRLRTTNDLPYVGLIGSATKWATFCHRLIERGFSADELARITCPIGIPGIEGKEPEVIAIAVAAQLLSLKPSKTA